MATKIVCDVCGGEVETDRKNGFDFRGARLSVGARFWEPKTRDWREADICHLCLANAAACCVGSRITTVPPPPMPTLLDPEVPRFRFLVTLTGVRCPGPHADFSFEADARRFIAACQFGGEIEIRETGK